MYSSVLCLIVIHILLPLHILIFYFDFETLYIYYIVLIQVPICKKVVHIFQEIISELRIYQQNPPMVVPLLQELSTANPTLLRLVNDNVGDFHTFLRAPGGQKSLQKKDLKCSALVLRTCRLQEWQSPVTHRMCPLQVALWTLQSSSSILV